MRGKQNQQPSLFSYVDIEDRIPVNHPLRTIRVMADEALHEMDATFKSIYSHTGRPSVPPEQLIKASLLQILYGIRSEIQLMEQMQYNLLFRWFVGLGVDERVWTPECFSVNRERLFNTGITKELLSAILDQARRRNLLSKDHFSVDGTLLKAWASQKSYRPKDEDPGSGSSGEDFHGENRKNDTHCSKTDPDARLYRKGPNRAAELSMMGHVVMENRNGLIVNSEVTVADGYGERTAALKMMETVQRTDRRVTLGGDKGYDVNEFHEQCRERNITPHIARRDDGRKSVLDGRTTRHEGYGVSITKRKLIEQFFGWMKSAGGIRQVKFRGLAKVGALMDLAVCMYNMVRMKNLAPI